MRRGRNDGDSPKRLAEAEAAANLPFSLEDAVVETERRPAKVVFSARIPSEYSEQIAEEARRCRQTPSQLIADLVIEALRARARKADLMVSLADVQRALNTIARQAA
jgi:hypothetical protein